MSRQPKGSQLALSPARKLVIEMLHHARRLPSIPVARTIQIADVAHARQQARLRPSWTAVFLRGYGLVCQEFAELRRAYLPWPYPHLYEHPQSIGAVAIERQLQGDSVLLAAKIRGPEDMPLEAIDGCLRRFKDAPITKVASFRQLLRIGRMPSFLRRFVFWHSLYLSGYKRAKRFGTFMVSSYGSLGAEQLHPLCPLTTLLTFGPIHPTGEVVVKVIYDHRVVDGRRIASCLSRLEEVLRTSIVPELQSLRRMAA